MKKIYSDIRQFRGSHYDFGFYQGEELKNSPIIKNRTKQWKTRKARFIIDERSVKEALGPFAPRIWDELAGLRDGLGWTIDDVLKEFGGYRLEYVRSGCSIFTNTDYMIRNYDYHPRTYEGRLMIYQPNDGGYAVIGPSQRITGRMDGMNEKGLAMGYNFIHRKKPGDGFICNMIGRIILERCASVKEAVAMLKEIPHRHSFTYTVLDKNGVTYVVEATPRGVEEYQSNVCTNHFELLKHENRHHLADSYKRMQAINESKGNVTDKYQAFRMMNDLDKGVFSDDYRNWSGTIHTSGYFPKEGKVWFALGGNREPVIFDFKKWMSGERITTTRILGQVDTDLPFAHMY
ncbi:acyl-CoA--6-aminopenicillanic acid acyltransferase [Virgibacillus phasianinus]|uniref:Acyl-CoA--6-aminopenicillanic acid acyltransferase n=1 Tax=Virgibacillus phasianinus TaxID=2017483 RepID=A0A220TZ68_9BACI|nr:C45 family peptidase [Virgibacillus phasianinus]ASK61117.1 acyl-CoA--6-aminopenicillanic acid acyltransferase [Virgibacillus phasianinus]